MGWIAFFTTVIASCYPILYWHSQPFLLYWPQNYSVRILIPFFTSKLFFKKSPIYQELEVMTLYLILKINVSLYNNLKIVYDWYEDKTL